MKRVFDFCFAFVLLVITFIPMLIITILIILESGFPVLFIQYRVGKFGVIFRMYKFRTMTVLKEAEEESFDAGDSSRVTKIGSFLRKTKLDELPQLINVLKGDMSVVGPRPEIRQWVNAYPERWRKVHNVKPGITDSASVYFRNEEQLLEKADDPQKYYRDVILPQKLSFYEDYASGHSFFKDITIIYYTIKKVFFNWKF